MAKRKAFFGLRYPDLKPIYLDHFGTQFQIAGILQKGKNNTYILLPLPDELPFDNAIIETIKDLHPNFNIVYPNLEQWMEVLKYLDDPQYFEEDETGLVKAIHRKCQRQIGMNLQWKIYRRDRFRCVYCGRDDVPLTIDHKTPVELGGTDEEDNLVACCRPCNKEKGNMSYSQWSDYILLEYQRVAPL